VWPYIGIGWFTHAAFVHLLMGNWLIAALMVAMVAFLASGMDW
jgi:hypothetical protein